MRPHALVLLFLLHLLAWPQSPSPQISAPATTPAVLPAGTTVLLRTTRSLDSEHVKAGDAVPLEIVDDVKAGDLLVIAGQTPVTATLTGVHRAGRGLRRGSLALELKAVNDIVGDPVPVSGGASAKLFRPIDSFTETTLSADLVFLPFAKGGEAVLPKGAKISAAVAHDFPLDAARLRDRMTVLDAEKARARTGKATVRFYLSPLANAREEHLLFFDGKRAARLRAARTLQMQVSPGAHVVQCNGHEMKFDAQPGQTYYIRVQPEGTWQNHWVPRLVARGEGEDQTYPLDPSDPKDVFVQ